MEPDTGTPGWLGGLPSMAHHDYRPYILKREATMQIEREQIERAVDKVLATDVWPVLQTYDDAGLTRKGYVDFVCNVLGFIPGQKTKQGG